MAGITDEIVEHDCLGKLVLNGSLSVLSLSLSNAERYNSIVTHKIVTEQHHPPVSYGCCLCVWANDFDEMQRWKQEMYLI